MNSPLMLYSFTRKPGGLVSVEIRGDVYDAETLVRDLCDYPVRYTPKGIHVTVPLPVYRYIERGVRDYNFARGAFPAHTKEANE